MPNKKATPPSSEEELPVVLINLYLSEITKKLQQKVRKVEKELARIYEDREFKIKCKELLVQRESTYATITGADDEILENRILRLINVETGKHFHIDRVWEIVLAVDKPTPKGMVDRWMGSLDMFERQLRDMDRHAHERPMVHKKH